jgi:hypothetical protein
MEGVDDLGGGGKTLARSLLISSVSALSEKIESVVSRVRENFRASSDLYEFIKLGNKNGVTGLYAVSHGYSDCMKAVGVRTRAELEQLWRRYYSDEQVRDAVEALLEGEGAFTQFLEEVERELIPLEDKGATQSPAAVGKVLPEDLALLDVSSDRLTTLDTYWKDSKFTLFVVVRHFG